MLCLVSRQTVYYALGLLLHDEKYIKFIWLILKIDKRKKEKNNVPMIAGAAYAPETLLTSLFNERRL